MPNQQKKYVTTLRVTRSLSSSELQSHRPGSLCPADLAHHPIHRQATAVRRSRSQRSGRDSNTSSEARHTTTAAQAVEKAKEKGKGRDGTKGDSKASDWAPTPRFVEAASSSGSRGPGRDPCPEGRSKRWGPHPWRGGDLLWDPMPIFWQGHRRMEGLVGKVLHGEALWHGPGGPIDLGKRHYGLCQSSHMHARLWTGCRRSGSASLRATSGYTHPEGSSRTALARCPHQCRETRRGRTSRLEESHGRGRSPSPRRSRSGRKRKRREKGGKGEGEEKEKGKEEEASQEFLEHIQIFDYKLGGQVQGRRTEGDVRGKWSRSPEEGSQPPATKGSEICSEISGQKGREQGQFKRGWYSPQGTDHFRGATACQGCGFISAQAIENMQELMLSEAGQESSQQEGWVPTLLKYYRQMLSRKVSGPMSRELHTLCTVGDLVLRGQLPEAMDTLIQRVKSLEAQISGLAWTSAQRLELLPSDGNAFVEARTPHRDYRAAGGGTSSPERSVVDQGRRQRRESRGSPRQGKRQRKER